MTELAAADEELTAAAVLDKTTVDSGTEVVRVKAVPYMLETVTPVEYRVEVTGAEEEVALTAEEEAAVELLEAAEMLELAAAEVLEGRMVADALLGTV